MLFIFILYIIFPLLILCSTKQSPATEITFFQRNDSNTIKGTASLLVIFAHIISIMSDLNKSNVLLKPFTMGGGIGVLIFFFLSGYGIYKSYNNLIPSLEFLKKRLINIYIPYVLMKICFFIVFLMTESEISVLKSVKYVFFEDWFVVVIVIQYVLFYTAWKFSYVLHSKNFLIPFCFLFSLLLAVLFVFWGLNPRWYNGLLLFPVGMYIAENEEQFVNRIDKNWLMSFAINIILFCVFGALFEIYKEEIWSCIIKTFCGISFSLLVCIIFRKISIKSKILIYIGRRSLYYYVVHVSLMPLIYKINIVGGKHKFFFSLLLHL